MSRKKKSASLESVQREIARRLRAKLPLAGMIAATALLCGCDELPGGKPVGIAPREDTSACEQKPEPKPKTPPPPKKNGNREVEERPTAGIPIPNKKNETVDPASTRGRFPSMKTEK